MSVTTEPRIQADAPPPRLAWSLTRRHLVYSVGAVSGFVWLLPVFGPPGGGLSGTDTSSIVRYLRIIMPLLVFLLIRRQTLRNIQQNLAIKTAQGALPRFILRLLGLVLVLGLIPLSAGLLTANSLFIISAVLPLTVSLLSILGIVLLDDQTFKDWVLGITGAAVLFLVVGMLTSHFEPTSFYGRPRVLLGFVHPIHTASVILASMGFGILMGYDWVRQLPTALQRLMTGLYGGIALILMGLAQSRNVLISLCLGLGCAWVGARTRQKTRTLIFTLILFLPISLYLFVLTGSPANPLWAAIDDFSSNRLTFLQSVLASSVDFNDPQQLFEPSSARLTSLSDYVGFASTDSVFQTFFFNYGLIALVSFLALLFVLGRKLSLRKADIYPFGAMCGIVFFFSLDTQGITTSNLILFVVFAYAIRAAVGTQVSSLENIPQRIVP